MLIHPVHARHGSRPLKGGLAESGMHQRTRMSTKMPVPGGSWSGLSTTSDMPCTGRQARARVAGSASASTSSGGHWSSLCCLRRLYRLWGLCCPATSRSRHLCCPVTGPSNLQVTAPVLPGYWAQQPPGHGSGRSPGSVAHRPMEYRSGVQML